MMPATLNAFRPMFVAGADVRKLDLRSVMMGWKGCREARRAVEVIEDDGIAQAITRSNDVVDWPAAHGVAAGPRIDQSLPLRPSGCALISPWAPELVSASLADT